MTPLLRKLIETLEGMSSLPGPTYAVPGLWVGSTQRVEFPNVASYFLHQLRKIDVIRHSRKEGPPWSIDRAVVYNAMVRHVTSYDHGSGDVDQIWRSSGTFLKLLALIPYLHQLGVDTLLLLPITDLGVVGKKGTLGSPYAVRNPFKIDANLAEPFLPMSVDDQARLLIETCHLLGMKVVVEFVLRTASVDSDLAGSHSEWFYWFNQTVLDERGEHFHPPAFTDEEVGEIEAIVKNGTMVGLPPPSVDYQELFDFMPIRLSMDNRGWKGVGARGRELRIPGAFADWPPNDTQPVWSDVTYLRLHDHPAYRYMAYNTIRMYERELDQPQFRQDALWNTIESIIPHFIRLFSIDGAMIDMGHALPSDLRARVVRSARAKKADFLLFEENFHLKKDSAVTGYDAVLGYLPFDAFASSTLEAFVQRVADSQIPVRYFSTSESHNTPRSASRLEARTPLALWHFMKLLPGGLSVIHAGLDLLEVWPVNTGLGFTEDELAKYPADKLPLFSDIPLSWDRGLDSAEAFKELHKKVNQFDVCRSFTDDDRIDILTTLDSDVVVFHRIRKGERRGLIVALNLSTRTRTIRAQIPKDLNVGAVASIQGASIDGAEIRMDLDRDGLTLVPTLIRITNVVPKKA